MSCIQIRLLISQKSELHEVEDNIIHLAMKMGVLVSGLKTAYVVFSYTKKKKKKKVIEGKNKIKDFPCFQENARIIKL